MPRRNVKAKGKRKPHKHGRYTPPRRMAWAYLVDTWTGEVTPLGPQELDS